VAVVSMEDVSAVAVSTAVAFVAAVSAVVVSTVDVSAAAFVVAVLMAATSVAIFAITDSLMMSSSATSAFRGGGVTRTDITVTAITRTLTMDTAGTHTATTVAGATVTMVGPVTDTAMAADQGMSGVRGVGDKPCYGSLKIRDEATCESSKSVRSMFGDKFGE
jgi:hypothetical protein